jgi:hypothetical protein
MAFCLSQLTLAFPLWLSMLLLLIEGDPNRKCREHNLVACTTIRKALHDLFDEEKGTFTVRVRTQHAILELEVEPSNVEMRTRADMKLLLMRANWIECCALNKSAVVFQ